MKTVACLIARTNSKRLSKKILREVQGKKVVEYIIQKIQRCRAIDDIYLCTSIDEEDSILLDIAQQQGIHSFAGSRELVIDRMMKVAESTGADNVIRITGDNIFTDEVYIDLMLKYHTANGAEYTRTEYLPMGVTGEVIAVRALQRCMRAIPPEYSEYMMLYLFQPDQYKCQVLIPPSSHRHPEWSLTVDTPDDWQRTLEITAGQTRLLNYHDIVAICTNKPMSHLLYKAAGSVKLPADVDFSYKAVRTEMEVRIDKAQKIPVTEKEYLEMMNAQLV